MAGFQPIRDERGKSDLFGNPMAVTQIGVADALASCAQVVMGERDEATAHRPHPRRAELN